MFDIQYIINHTAKIAASFETAKRKMLKDVKVSEKAVYISNLTLPSLKQNTSGCLKTIAAITFPSSGFPGRLGTSPRNSSSLAICSVFIPC